MAAATNYIPVELYLKSDYEPDAEYVDGVIEERPTGQWDHASWQQAVQRWFIMHATEWNVRVRPGLRVQVAPTRFRVPDVTVVDRNQQVEQIVTHPPLAVFEILSPEDTFRRSLRKLKDYSAMGISHIWVIDPEAKVYYQFTESKLVSASHFGAPVDRIHFAITEMEAYLD